MKKIYSLLSLLVFLTASVAAQSIDSPCGTTQGRSPWLKKYQKSPDNYAKGGDTTLYIAMSIHILGTDDGAGYYTRKSLMNAFCKLNELYANTGIQFYQAGEVDYINNSSYYNHETLLEGAEMMFTHNVPNTLNTYFVSSPAGNCGYNLPYAGIANAKSCSGPNDVTWAHEVGHALSLPHPFFGWEDNGYVPDDEVHNYSNSAPDTVFMDDYTYFQDTLILDTVILDSVLVEKVDGSNCELAADGFCDTPPDYLSDRWTCNSNGVSPQVQRDPNGVAFQSDGSLIMNYADDNCQNRFSPDQQGAMRAFVLDEHPEWATETNQLPPVANAPNALEPLDGADVISVAGELSWEPVDNATHYLVLVSRLSSYISGLTFEYVTTNTSLITDELLDGKTYHWKILAFNEHQFCGEYNSSQTFVIYHPQTLVNTIQGVTALKIYPQPLLQNQALSLSIEMNTSWDGQVEIKNQLGQTVFGQSIELNPGANNKQLDLSNLSKGVYWLAITNGAERLVRKVIIQ